MAEVGTLYICPTPIGNLEDITLRALNTLKSVDIVAAEDTRHTIKLLNHFDIKKPLTSYHEHNIKEKGPLLINKLLNGNDIALVSDAGMPGISDPGEDLIRLCIDEGIIVDVLPGATASITALVSSGLSTERFVFEGFLSSNKKERQKQIQELKNETRTIILYESPHRLKSSLKDLNEILNDRKVCVARELTKRYQEIFRGNLSEALKKFSEEKIRGEFVIVLEGISTDSLEIIKDKFWDDLSIKDHIGLYVDTGFSKKEAVKKVAKERGIPKRDVYRESIGM
ncbi:16S rRNA (cytidine(1402)-2'-O)-methyltransferase [Clostridiisalibacter paucivorans]|uniref:16S rRNA (cytidine(1402)-2'-O)-methyltransferase n=1 Tax=Clostridiisalibacter paucivorans TaxID=408753 RepID=UPI00047B59CE|nr:16S rRNA (cytidine(1402)-2'-O)-methyltransferase [Clostridiisalibacter paucivorans]